MSVVQVAQWSSLSSWAPPSSGVGGGDWPLVPLSELLHPLSPTAYKPSEGETVRFAGVRWYGNGVFVREERPAEKVTAKCYPLVPGALVYNRLFGWKSAFALVGNEMDGVVVSNEFPQFEIDGSAALPAYINLVCGSPTFAKVMLSRSTGSTAVSRNRLHPRDLLDLEIPLPDPVTQAELVAQFDTDRGTAARLRASAAERRDAARARFCQQLGVTAGTTPSGTTGHVTIARYAALSRWDVQSADETLTSRYPIKPLEAHADIRLGTQVPRRGARVQDGVDRRYLRAANVQRGWFALDDVKTMQVSQSTAESLRLRPNDLLFVEGNSQTEVGRAAVWSCDDDTIIQNSVIRARTDDELDPYFAAAWFNTAEGRRYFADSATTTTGSLWHIGSGKTGKAPIPVPPPDVQQSVAEEHWDEMTLADAEETEAAALDAAAVRDFAEAVFGTEALTAPLADEALDED